MPGRAITFIGVCSCARKERENYPARGFTTPGK